MASNLQEFKKNISSLPSGLKTAFSDVVAGSAVTITIDYSEDSTIVFYQLACTSDSSAATITISYNGTTVFSNAVGSALGTVTSISCPFIIAPPNPVASGSVSVVLTATTSATLNVTYAVVACGS